MPDLADKTVLLGVTGGISAYKVAELARLLVKAGVNVKVVMTEAGQQFVTPLTFRTLTGNPVATTLVAGETFKSEATSSPYVVANVVGVWCFRATYTPSTTCLLYTSPSPRD